MQNFSLKALGYAAITALALVPAAAQTRYCMGGDLDHLSAAERASCGAAKEAVRAMAGQLHTPEDWHFVIVCGEQGWKDYTAVAQRSEVALADSMADTDFDGHVTYLRQSQLFPSDRKAPQQLLLRELATIQLHTHDSLLIEAQVKTWNEMLKGKGAETMIASAQDPKLANSGSGL